VRRLVVLAVLLGCIAPGALATADQSAPRKLSSRLQVKAYDYGFILSRPAVKAGRVTIEFFNTGEDTHNLRLKRLHSRARIRGTRDVERSERLTRTFRLRPGTFRLFCSLPGHAKAGMNARLQVRRPG